MRFVKDLSSDDAALKSRIDTAFRFLAVEGLFVLGLGLGWSIGLRVSGSPVSNPAIFLLGLGLITSFAALALFLYRRRFLNSGGFLTHRAVDIRDSLRALRIHGSQVPLIERENLRSEILNLTRPESIVLPDQHRFILEHWSGPNAVVSLANTELELTSEQILYFDSRQMEFYSKGKRFINLQPIDVRADEDLVVVLHILSEES